MRASQRGAARIRAKVQSDKRKLVVSLEAPFDACPVKAHRGDLDRIFMFRVSIPKKLWQTPLKARWPRLPHIARVVPRGWRQSHAEPMFSQAEATELTTMPHAACRSAWARLIAKVYERDLSGGSWLRSGQREPASLSPVWLRDETHRGHHRHPAELRTILRHLLELGRAPPGLDPRKLELNASSINAWLASCLWD